MTHHNFLTYGVELGSVSFESLKNEKYGHWQFIGFTGDRILFGGARLSKQNKRMDIERIHIKGKATIGVFLSTLLKTLFLLKI